MSQLLQNWWQINCVGLLLHYPTSTTPQQPPAQWFVDQNIPVWYRWGEREICGARSPDFPLIKPSPEHLQSTTTWITSMPSTYVGDLPQLNNSFSLLSPQPQSEEHSFDLRPMPPEPQPPMPRVTSPRQEPPKNQAGPKQRIRDYGSGHHVWGPFFEKQEQRHQGMLEKETTKTKLARLSRMKQPPMTSCLGLE